MCGERTNGAGPLRVSKRKSVTIHEGKGVWKRNRSRDGPFTAFWKSRTVDVVRDLGLRKIDIILKLKTGIASLWVILNLGRKS